jgi:nitroimidazol reductase NimA-like FMN-containing flavoprotein (pyridoxamine 5'-phosphate oxidase superfamily)
VETERTRVRRVADRADYQRSTINAIIDAAKICHVAYVSDGEPRMVPTAIVRIGDQVYLHGNRRGAMIRALEDGALACVSVTHLDGLVAARSGFHCSMNYRSVVLFGHAGVVSEADKEQVLDAFVGSLIPGHGQAVRRATAQELAATTALAIPIDEASAKVRVGPPVDDDKDLALPMWAGVLPMTTRVGAPVPSNDLVAGIEVPAYIANLVTEQ